MTKTWRLHVIWSGTEIFRFRSQTPPEMAAEGPPIMGGMNPTKTQTRQTEEEEEKIGHQSYRITYRANGLIMQQPAGVLRIQPPSLPLLPSLGGDGELEKRMVPSPSGHSYQVTSLYLPMKIYEEFVFANSG
jgi:hypothetical protein